MTLTTDVGWAYAAQMKGVLTEFVSPAQIIDLGHDLPAHGVREASFLLRHMAGGFPARTVHLAVVDPGVGGVRAPLAVACRDGSFLVGPDNGLLIPLADHLGVRGVFRLLPKRVRPGHSPSATFEGRDVFAPAAGRLASGTPIQRLGVRHVPFRPSPWRAARQGDSVVGELLHIDQFGNLITSIPTDWLSRSVREWRVSFARRRTRILPRVRTYQELKPRLPGILGSSFGLIEVTAREARVADRWKVRVGSTVAFQPFSSRVGSGSKERKYVRT